MLRLPLTSTLLATLLLGADGVQSMPVVIVAVVVAHVVTAHVAPASETAAEPDARASTPATGMRATTVQPVGTTSEAR